MIFSNTQYYNSRIPDSRYPYSRSASSFRLDDGQNDDASLREKVGRQRAAFMVFATTIDDLLARLKQLDELKSTLDTVYIGVICLAVLVYSVSLLLVAACIVHYCCARFRRQKFRGSRDKNFENCPPQQNFDGEDRPQVDPGSGGNFGNCRAENFQNKESGSETREGVGFCCGLCFDTSSGAEGPRAHHYYVPSGDAMVPYNHYQKMISGGPEPGTSLPNHVGLERVTEIRIADDDDVKPGQREPGGKIPTSKNNGADCPKVSVEGGDQGNRHTDGRFYYFGDDSRNSSPTDITGESAPNSMYAAAAQQAKADIFGGLVCYGVPTEAPYAGVTPQGSYDFSEMGYRPPKSDHSDYTISGHQFGWYPESDKSADSSRRNSENLNRSSIDSGGPGNNASRNCSSDVNSSGEASRRASGEATFGFRDDRKRSSICSGVLSRNRISKFLHRRLLTQRDRSVSQELEPIGADHVDATGSARTSGHLSQRRGSNTNRKITISQSISNLRRKRPPPGRKSTQIPSNIIIPDVRIDDPDITDAKIAEQRKRAEQTVVDYNHQNQQHQQQQQHRLQRQFELQANGTPDQSPEDHKGIAQSDDNIRVKIGGSHSGTPEPPRRSSMLPSVQLYKPSTTKHHVLETDREEQSVPGEHDISGALQERNMCRSGESLLANKSSDGEKTSTDTFASAEITILKNEHRHSEGNIRSGKRGSSDYYGYYQNSAEKTIKVHERTTNSEQFVGTSHAGENCQKIDDSGRSEMDKIFADLPSPVENDIDSETNVSTHPLSPTQKQGIILAYYQGKPLPDGSVAVRTSEQLKQQLAKTKPSGSNNTQGSFQYWTDYKK